VSPVAARLWGWASSRWAAPAGLALLCAFHLVVNLWWVSQETTFFGPETLVHMRIDQDHYQHVHCLMSTADGPLEGLAAVAGYQNQPNHNSPFLALVTGLLLAPWRWGPRLPLAITLALHPVLLVSVYAMGRRAAGLRGGLMAALMVGLVPGVVGAGRHYCHDWTMGVLALACLALLLASDRYRRPLPTLAAGVVLGLGFLVKGQILFYLALPMAGLLAEGLLDGLPRGRRDRAVRSLAGFGAVAALGAALSAVWWWGNLGAMVSLLGHHADDWKEVATEFGGRLSPLHLLFYPHLLLRDASVPVLAAAALGLVATPGLLWRWRNDDAGAPRRTVLRSLLLFAGSAMFVYALVMTKNTRYAVPMLPALGVMAAVGLVGLRRPRLRWGLSGALLVFLGLQFVHASFPARVLPTPAYSAAALRDYSNIQCADGRIPLLFGFHTAWSHPPLGGVPEARVEEIAAIVATRWREIEARWSQSPSLVGVLGATEYPLVGSGFPLTYAFETRLHQQGVLPPAIEGCGPGWLSHVVHSVHWDEAVGQLAPLVQACDSVAAMVVLSEASRPVQRLDEALERLAAVRDERGPVRQRWWEAPVGGRESANQLTDCAEDFELVGRVPFPLGAPRLLEEVPDVGWQWGDYSTTEHHDPRKWALDPKDWITLDLEAAIFSRRLEAPVVPMEENQMLPPPPPPG
jgi:4-amino-4-deoxy-L-arabinose transferase-like glycosyltransferase